MKFHPGLFRQYRQELPKRSYFKQLFHTYALISGILFLLFSLLMTYYVNKDYGDTLVHVQKNGIEQAHDLNQTLLVDIASSCSSIMEDTDIIKLLYSPDTDYNLLIRARSLNDQLRQSSSIIQSVYFINLVNGTILDSYGRSSLARHYDTEFIEYLSSMTPTHRLFLGLPRTIRIPLSGGKLDTRVFSLIFYSNKNGALAVNIDYDIYSHLFQTEGSPYLSQIQISGDGKVFAASDSGLFGSDFNDDPIYQKISSIRNISGSYTTNIDKKTCRIDFRHNSGLNITYYGIFNESGLYTGNHLIWIVILSGAAFFVLCILASFIVSLILYRPVHSLTKLASESSSSGGRSSDLNDFDYISSVYKEITAANKRLANISSNYVREKDRSMLKRLLDSNNRILPSEYESLNQYFSGKYYQIVIISIDFDSQQQEGPDGVSLLKYAISNVMNELFEQSLLYMHLDLVSPNVNYFVNHNDETEQILLSTLKKGQDFLQSNFGVTLSIGVGVPVVELDELSLSFSSANEALSCRFINGNGTLQQATALALADAESQHYPYEADSEIIAAIKNLDRDGVCAALDSFLAAIKNFHMDQIIRSILQLDVSLQRHEYALEITSEQMPWSLETLPLLNLETIRTYFEDRCRQDISALTEIRSHSNEKPELIDTILRLVDDNLYNPNLSVVYLAGEVHLSVNYLRSIFKENTGDSLSNYITGKKIDLICDLLKNTDTSLQDISDMLGFSTKNYFFTFFKKHMQITPGEYRRQNLQQ